jgi:gluconokinase
MNTNFFLLMGVSGCGKTTVGKLLAMRLGWDFYDADDYHPSANIAKMGAGIPLNDDDRAIWLATLHELISSCLNENRPGVLACSALKEYYRQVLLTRNDNVQIVYLKGTLELIQTRMAARYGHFMKPAMLQSQFDILEVPKKALTVDISLPLNSIVNFIIAGAE